MTLPANIRPVAAIAHPTAFKPGQSGNPLGRTPGTRNRVTIEAQLAAAELVDDPAHRAALRERMIAGTAGAMEPLMWFYAKGKPVRGEMWAGASRPQESFGVKSIDGGIASAACSLQACLLPK